MSAFDRETKIVLYYDSRYFSNALSNDVVQNVLDSVNDHLDTSVQKYSEEQVKQALWKFLEAKIESFVEEIDVHWDKIDTSEKYDLLGEPEIDVAEENRLEAVDRACDESRGT